MQVDDMIFGYCVHIIWFHNAIHSALVQLWCKVFLHETEFPVNLCVWAMTLSPSRHASKERSDMPTPRQGKPGMAKWVAKEANTQSSSRPSLRGNSSAAWKPSWLWDINKHSIEGFMISVKDKSTYLQMFPSLPCQWTSLSFRLLGGLDEETHQWHLAEPIKHVSVNSTEDGSHLIIEINPRLGIWCC